MVSVEYLTGTHMRVSDFIQTHLMSKRRLDFISKIELNDLF